MRKRLCFNVFAHSNRSAIREDNVHLHATHHAPSIEFPRVDWINFILKVDMGERRKTLNIWLNEYGTELELSAQDSRPRTQKNIRGQRQLFEDRPFLGQGNRRKCSPKKKKNSNNNNNKVFKKFFLCVLKKTKSKKQVFLQKMIYKILKIPKILLFSSQGQGNFRGLEGFEAKDFKMCPRGLHLCKRNVTVELKNS